MIATTQGRKFATQQSLNMVIWEICDILRRSNCAGALQYVPELTWILFLRVLDESEMVEQAATLTLNKTYVESLVTPFRWQDWAAPDSLKRTELQSGAVGGFMNFINNKLLPYLRNLAIQPGATPRQKVIAQIMSGVERVRIDTENNLLEVLDRVNNIRLDNVDPTHIFMMSQVYESLLLKMGEKGNDGGQFFTPREIIRAMVQVVAPQFGEKIYDPCCGTGGFLAQSYEFISAGLGATTTDEALHLLKHETFYGREKENLIYPIALANLLLHGINEPHLWHGNTLTGNVTYDDLYIDTPTTFDVVLTNPPFGGKESKEAQTNFAYKSSATQILFLQHVIDSLKVGGRGGIVLDEGVLFRTNETGFLQTKRKLLNECDVYCIVSLPEGIFTTAGAGIKTDLLFFNKGQRTERIWYYDLSDVKVGKKTPFILDRFTDFFRLLPERADSERSWTLTRHQIEAKNYDLKAVNPHAHIEEDSRTPADLIALIEEQSQQVLEALAFLRR